MVRTDPTQKEIEVLALIAQGHDAKSAALELGVSTHTVYERLRRAREKLGVSNSREAARLMFAPGKISNEKLVSEKLVLDDQAPVSAFPWLPDLPAESDESDNSINPSVNRRGFIGTLKSEFLLQRGEGESDVRVNKYERLRLIGTLSTRLAMAFVAICLAALVLSNLYAHG